LSAARSGVSVAGEAKVDFRILGPLEVISDGKALDLGGPKQRALLALLLLEANRVVSSDRLIEALWEETPPPTARKALQVHVANLRKLVGKERLQTRAPGYLLRVAPGELDLTRFRHLREEGKLGEALALWRGPALAELAYERFAQPEIERLEELRVVALEERIERDLARGLHAQLVGELERLVSEYPLRERLSSQLMLALYRSGRQAEALDAFQVARRELVEELGIEPGRELRELHQAILNQDPSLDVVSTTAVPEESETTRGAFVGREAELQALLSGLDDVFAGRGRLFLLQGEPGIGKSRLADELARRAKSRGARVLVGRCWEAGGAPAYWPWVQALRAYIRESDASQLRAELGGDASEIAQLLPELREFFPDLREPLAPESDGARFRMFDATAEFLRRASDSCPLVLVLDDLHAADAPSLLLLEFLARVLNSTRILVLGAYRDVDPLLSRRLMEMLGEVAREPVTRRLPLRGLGERDVAAYLELTASEIASSELAAELHEETEGNPLFVGEMVRLLAAEGLSLQADRVRLAIPESVREVITRRLGHLSEESNRILLLAAVLGREFALDALAFLGGVSEDELLETLDEAMVARLVSDLPGGAGRLRFAHVLIRDALYEGLTTARRMQLHRAAAEAFEALHGEEPGPHLAELAHHSIAGRDFEKGLRYASRAGDDAFSLLAYEEASRLYGTALNALELARPSDEEARCHLLLSLGEAEARAGNGSAAKRAFLDAAGIARRLDLSREFARAAMGYGGRLAFGRAGDDHRLVPLLEEGLAAVGEEDVELRARLLARLAGALRDEHSRNRRDALSREAVELARRTGDAVALAYALDGRIVAIVAPDTVAEVLALATELRQVAERIGDAERLISAHSHRLMAQLLVGDVHGGKADLDAAGRIAEELGQPVRLWGVCSERTMLALATGRLDEAEELVEQGLALGESAQPDAVIPVYRLQRATLCDFRGGIGAAEPAIRELVAAYPARAVFRCALGRLFALSGRLDDAKRVFDDLADDDFSALPFDQEWLYGMSLLAETCALLGDRDAAPVLYRLLLPYADLNAVDVTEGFAGSVSRYLGLLASTMERWEDAARHLGDALAMNERMGARPWLAHTQCDYARVLLTRDGSGDRDRGREIVNAAVATYRELGMETHAASAAALAREIGAAAH
jgi:eukaryotic-like serine/threonine-protein kinase